MRKKILAFVFAAVLLMAMAVPLFGGSVYAMHDKGNQKSVDSNTELYCHKPGTPAQKTILLPTSGDRFDDHTGHGDTAGAC